MMTMLDNFMSRYINYAEAALDWMRIHPELTMAWLIAGLIIVSIVFVWNVSQIISQINLNKKEES